MGSNISEGWIVPAAWQAVLVCAASPRLVGPLSRRTHHQMQWHILHRLCIMALTLTSVKAPALREAFSHGPDATTARASCCSGAHSALACCLAVFPIRQTEPCSPPRFRQASILSTILLHAWFRRVVCSCVSPGGTAAGAYAQHKRASAGAPLFWRSVQPRPSRLQPRWRPPRWWPNRQPGAAG